LEHFINTLVSINLLRSHR